MGIDSQDLRRAGDRCLPVQDVDTALVMKILEPIWSKKSETAGRQI